MSTEELANNLLTAFATELEFDPTEVKLHDGYSCVGVDQTGVLHLRLQESARALDLFMELGQVPEHGRDDILADMLQGNVLFQATEGSALGFDRERNIAVVTMRLFIPGLEYIDFRAGIERFLSVAAFWRQRIQTPFAEQTPGDTASGDQLSQFTVRA